MEIKILHIIREDKFYLSVRKNFDRLDGIKNYFMLYNEFVDYKKNVKTLLGDEIFCYSQKDFISYIEKEKITIVLFHSLPPKEYRLIASISQNIKVIWWGWGFDIYNSYKNLPPLVRYNIFKPYTKEKYVNNNVNFKKRIKILLNYLYYIKEYCLRKKAIARIDYYMAVLEIDYNLLKSNSFFKAKVFWNIFPRTYIEDTALSKTGWNVLIGNSATPTNNHLDIIAKLPKLKENAQYILPLNYGDKKYAEVVIKNIEKSNISECTTILDKFIPYNEYNEKINTCSYAVFGVLRQQAIGNVLMCIRKGIKIFLYKDSIVYKQLKEKDGYVIYTIDNDLTEIELHTPLTKEEIDYNRNIYYSFIDSEDKGIAYLKAEIEKVVK